MTLEENIKKGTGEVLFVKHIPDGKVQTTQKYVLTLRQQIESEPYTNWGHEMLRKDYEKCCKKDQCKDWYNVKKMFDMVMKPLEPLYQN